LPDLSIFEVIAPFYRVRTMLIAARAFSWFIGATLRIFVLDLSGYYEVSFGLSHLELRLRTLP
jgi:hypothetical protein